MQLLRSILSQEFRSGNLMRDPSLNVKQSKNKKLQQIDPLSSDELELALMSIDKHYQPLFYTLAYTGCRPNELLALRWSDIYWNKEVISITKGRVRGEEGLQEQSLANGRCL